jgi:hypothetical protein
MLLPFPDLSPASLSLSLSKQYILPSARLCAHVVIAPSSRSGRANSWKYLNFEVWQQQQHPSITTPPTHDNNNKYCKPATHNHQHSLQRPIHGANLRTNSHPPCRLAHPLSRNARPRPRPDQLPRRPGRTVHSITTLRLSDISNFVHDICIAACPPHCSFHYCIPAHRIALHVRCCTTITRAVLLCAHSATQTTVASTLQVRFAPITDQPVVSPLRVCLAESRQSPASSNALVAL